MSLENTSNWISDYHEWISNYESSNSEEVASILKHAKSFVDSFDSICQDNEEQIFISNKNKIEAIDIVIARLTNFIFLVLPYFNKRDCVNDTSAYSYKVTRYYLMHLANTVNNIIAIRSLLLMGLDTQAKILFRYQIELCNLSIVFLDSKDVFEFYSKPTDNTGIHKTPKFGTIESKLKRIISKLIELDEEKDIEKTLEVEWNRINKENYSYFSSIAHGNYIATILSVYKQSSLNSESFSFSLGGTNSDGVKSVLDDLALYMLFTIKFSEDLLRLNHNFLIKNYKSDNVNEAYFKKLDECLLYKILK